MEKLRISRNVRWNVVRPGKLQSDDDPTIAYFSVGVSARDDCHLASRDDVAPSVFRTRVAFCLHVSFVFTCLHLMDPYGYSID